MKKARAVKDYKLCDHLSTEVRQLLKEKAELERQISAIERKEKKASWYRKKSKSKVPLINISEPDTQTSTQEPITTMLRADSEKKINESSDISSQPSKNLRITTETASTVVVSDHESTGDLVQLERSESNSSNDTIIPYPGGEQDF